MKLLPICNADDGDDDDDDYDAGDDDDDDDADDDDDDDDSHLDPPANGQAVVYLTGLLEVFKSESFILAV